jgi:asparagine synthase (glutamine-hydrolysing)
VQAFEIVPKVVYHLETYEPELIRSAIPNYFLAKLAGSHTKVVLTGEGADELFAGYLYFRDAPNTELLHAETLRIFDHLSCVNLQRADRMCMAHGLEARVPFLDVQMLQEAYEVRPRTPYKQPNCPGRPLPYALG